MKDNLRAVGLVAPDAFGPHPIDVQGIDAASTRNSTAVVHRSVG